MKNKFIFIAIMILFFLVFFIEVSSDEVSYLNLNEGKNYVSFNLSEPFYVETLVKLNPDIQVVSYIGNNKSIGYINIFNGIGENFLVESSKEYEIIVKGDTRLIVPK